MDEKFGKFVRNKREEKKINLRKLAFLSATRTLSVSIIYSGKSGDTELSFANAA